ncbi:MAG: M48 family metalloprotease [Cyanobacteria bacterium P01_A01_bin.37]
MPLTQAQFDRLVHRLEPLSNKQPGQYKFQVWLLSLLGYAYIAFILVVLWSVLAFILPTLTSLLADTGRTTFRMARYQGMLILFVIAIPIILSLIILDALWVTIPPPEGIQVKRNQCPELFKVINSIAKELGTPPFHHVLITSDFNASVLQVPRLGILGFYTNYLLVGLPLMQVMSPAQFRAVLAHEFGHLSGKHGQFGHWVYRIRHTWYVLCDRLHTIRTRSDNELMMVATTIGAGLFETFFNWYAPYFAAYSFVLARTDEYEADRYSARLAGNRNLAAALANLEVQSRALNTVFWPQIYQRADSEADLPEPFSELEAFASNPLKPDDMKTWLKEAFVRQTDTVDTHPCLKDRLVALKCPMKQVPALLKPTKTNAARQFLGKAHPHIVRKLNQDWQLTISSEWQHRHRVAQTMRDRIETIDNKAIDNQSIDNQNHNVAQEQTRDDICEKAILKANLGETDEAIALVQHLLDQDANHDRANLTLGQLLLHKGDKQGIQYLEMAMEKNFRIVPQALMLIGDFLTQTEGEAAGQRYRKQAQQRFEIQEKARRERSNVTHHHQFKLHGLSTKDIDALNQQLATYRPIKTAYLVQKVVTYMPERPFYVLGIESSISSMDRGGQEENIALSKRLVKAIDTSYDVMIVVLDINYTALKSLFRQMDGACIYSK